MCLNVVNPVKPNKTKGFAYKVVKPNRDATLFTGQWAKFNVGSGGVDTTLTKGVHRNNVVWKLGRMYRVKHNRQVEAFDTGQLYKAGVHLFKRITYANCKRSWTEVILVCYYTSGHSEDGSTIVANRVTPLVMLESTSAVVSFEIMVKNVGIKEAIRRYQRYRDLNET